MSELINLAEVRNFSRNVEDIEFLNLLLDNNIGNFDGLDDIGIRESQESFAQLLALDYYAKRANPFAYDWTVSKDVQFYNELRKSTNLTKYGLDFLAEHNMCRTIDDIVQTRRRLLRSDFKDYDDRRWQYWWAQFFKIPEEQREDYLWDVEDLFADCPKNWKPQDNMYECLPAMMLRRGKYANDDWQYEY